MILIRQQCQQILDDCKMSQFHVQMSEPRWSGDQPYLEIATECGKRLMLVRGIPTKRTQYSYAEREYIVELFGDFMLKYKQEIVQYLKAKQAITKHNDTFDNELKAAGYTSMNRVFLSDKNKTRLRALEYTDGIFKLMVIKGVTMPMMFPQSQEVGAKSTGKMSLANEEYLRELQSWAPDTKKLQQAHKDVVGYAKRVADVHKAKEELERLTGVFETCSI